MKLTYAKIAEISGKDVREVEILNASKLQVEELDDLNVCVELRKLDLSQNILDSLSGLETCATLTWLNLSHNKLESLRGLQELTELTVLNVSYNQIPTVNFIQDLIKLKALVLNNNRIINMENFSNLRELNTLILSHNRIQEIKGLRTLKNLVKLNLGHNQIRTICSLEANQNLKELRLNDNKISSIPSFFVYNSNLQLLDFGNNVIRDISSVESIRNLLHLYNLNLKGNPIAKIPSYYSDIKQMAPALRVFDGERFDPRFLKRKELKQKHSQHQLRHTLTKRNEDKPNLNNAPNDERENFVDEKNNTLGMKPSVLQDSKSAHENNDKGTSNTTASTVLSGKRAWDAEDQEDHVEKKKNDTGFSDHKRSGVVKISSAKSKFIRDQNANIDGKFKREPFSLQVVESQCNDGEILPGWD